MRGRGRARRRLYEENVRAILDAAGFENVEVLRMSADEIGCTLADAADDAKYNAWLRRRGGAESARGGGTGREK